MIDLATATYQFSTNNFKEPIKHNSVVKIAGAAGDVKITFEAPVLTSAKLVKKDGKVTASLISEYSLLAAKMKVGATQAEWVHWAFDEAPAAASEETQDSPVEPEFDVAAL